MKDAVRSASEAADGMASEPPGWKSFWMSMRRSVVMVSSFVEMRRLQVFVL